jgi:hypothetical protein
VLKSALSKIFGSENYLAIKTFTYYLPSPPDRKTGYQEKEFDQITSYLIGRNFNIIDFKMQACANEKSSGVWIMCILGAKDQAAANMDLDIDYNSIVLNKENKIEIDPSIEHEH